MALSTLAVDDNEHCDTAFHPLLGAYGRYDVVDIYGLYDGLYRFDILYYSRYVPYNEHHRLCHTPRPIAHR